MSAATPQPPQPRLRWFQFRLRTLLLLTTLVVGLLVIWRTYVAPYQEQRRTLELVKELKGRCQTTAAQAWLRRLFGDDFQNIVLIDVADCDEPARYLGAIVELPCLETLVVGGEKFTDDHLQRLRSIGSLRGLVLDCTDVSDEGVEALQRALPEVEIYRSQRRAIADLTLGGGNAAHFAAYRHWPVETQICTAHAELRRLVGDDYFREAVAAEIWIPDDHQFAELKRLTSLQTLSLIDAQPTRAQLGGLAMLTNLRWLELRRVQLPDTGLAVVARLPSLQGLSLEGSSVSDAALEHLELLTNLRGLWLNGTQVTDASLVRLKGLVRLHTLSLENTGITDAGLAELHEMPDLQFVTLRNTKVTNKGIRALQTALPGCRVGL